MKKFLVSTISSSLLAGTLLLGGTTTPVLAGSYGDCSSQGVENWTGGYKMWSGSHPKGAIADVRLPATSYFHLCSPDDGNANASVANVGVKDYGNGALFNVILLRCVHRYSFCDGKLHLIVEANSGIPFATHWFVDYGVTSICTEQYCELKVKYVSGTIWRGYYNGAWLGDFDIAGLHPDNSEIKARWYGEAWDNGDGVGNNVAGQRLVFDNLQWRDTNWDWHYATTTCNMTDGGGHVYCRISGTTGVDAYSVN